MAAALICILGAVALLAALLWEPKPLVKRICIALSVVVIAAGMAVGGIALYAPDTPTEPAVPTPGAVTPVPEMTATPTPTPTQAPTPAPTPTAAPTPTPTPKPTPTKVPMPTQKPTSSPSPTPPPETPEATESPAAPETPEDVRNTVVYVSASDILHLKSNCSGMKNYREMTLGEAEGAGLSRRCKKCFAKPLE